MTAEFSPTVHELLDVRSGGFCEVCGVADMLEHHHRRGRGQGSTKRPESTAVTNALVVCRSCHRLIESYRSVALMLGWAVRQAADPAAQPVLYRGLWVRLDDDGSITSTPQNGVPS